MQRMTMTRVLHFTVLAVSLALSVVLTVLVNLLV